MKSSNSLAGCFPLSNKGAKFLMRNIARKSRARRATVSTFAGDGISGFTDGPADKARFKSPLDVVAIPGGGIFVADAFNSCVRKIEHGLVSTFAGNGSANIIDGIRSEARFKIPCRVTADNYGNLFVLDAADPRIRKIDALGRVTTWAGAKEFGFRDSWHHNAQFGQSFGIISDWKGNLYVSDSQNSRIRKISATGIVETIAGNGTGGALDGKAQNATFHFPTGIVTDARGNLFVSDVNRIRKITKNGTVSTFAGSLQSGFVDGKKNVARFSQIESLAIDPKGNIYLADEHRIRMITPGGFVLTIAGSTAGYQDGDALSARFDKPQGLSVDSQGNIYVADLNNNRIRKITFM